MNSISETGLFNVFDWLFVVSRSGVIILSFLTFYFNSNYLNFLWFSSFLSLYNFIIDYFYVSYLVFLSRTLFRRSISLLSLYISDYSFSSLSIFIYRSLRREQACSSSLTLRILLVYIVISYCLTFVSTNSTEVLSDSWVLWLSCSSNILIFMFWVFMTEILSNSSISFLETVSLAFLIYLSVHSLISSTFYCISW